jgi:hypothetical protein
MIVSGGLARVPRGQFCSGTPSPGCTNPRRPLDHGVRVQGLWGERIRGPYRLRGTAAGVTPMARRARSIWFVVVFFLGCGSEGGTQFTACPAREGWSFAVIGDTQSHPDVFSKHVSHVNQQDPLPVALFHTGDKVNNGDSDLEWSIFHQVMSSLSPEVEFYPAPGNHDVGGTVERELYKEEFNIQGPLYSAREFRSVLFVVLSTEEPESATAIGGEQLLWLEETLSHSPTGRIAVFMHHPLFPQGHYQNEGLANAQEIHALFVRYGVDVVFAAHEHQFFLNERDGVSYVISGGGGGPLYHENGGDFYHFLLAYPGEGILCLEVVTLSGDIGRTYEIPFN